MQVKELMTSDVRIASADQSICETAQIMADTDFGSLPVSENDRLVGVITDRDIAVRAVAKHKSPDTPVREVMSPDVLYCYEDDDADEVARNMGENQVRRMPVLNRSKRLVGIVALSDLWARLQKDTAVEALADISKPGGPKSQTATEQELA